MCFRKWCRCSLACRRASSQTALLVWYTTNLPLFSFEWKLSKITFQYEVTKNVKQVPKIWTWYESYNSVAFSIMCCGTWPQIFESLSTISDLSPNLHISPLQYLNCHQWICHVLYYSNEITPWILVKCCCQDSHTREILQSASDSQ